MVNIATMSPIGAYVVDGPVREFRKARPELKISVRETVKTEVLEEIKKERADLEIGLVWKKGKRLYSDTSQFVQFIEEDYRMMRQLEC